VKHDLCYWMSNKHRITDDSKFNDNQGITVTDICIIVIIFLPIKHSFLLQVLYMVWCLSKLYADTIFVKTTCKCFQRKEKKTQIGTSVRARVFNAGLLTRSQFASGRSCDRPIRSRFSVVFIVPRANAKLVPKVHVALHASHAALSMVTPKISP
jgi:hypothetical protein